MELINKTETTLDKKEETPTNNEKGSMIPYVVGWLLGVPVSILFLIALFRAVF